MINSVIELLKPFLASDYALLVVASVIGLVIYFYTQERKAQEEIKNNFIEAVATKFKKVDNNLTKIEPMKIQMTRVETRLDDMSENMVEHKAAMGNASKAIAGDFLKLSQSITDNISEIKSIVENVKFDFVNSQNDMRIIAEKLESIVKDLDVRYSRVIKLQDQANETYGRVKVLEERGDWTKKVIQENRDALVQTKLVLQNFKERLDRGK